MHVLKTGESKMSTNVGFRHRASQMMTYHLDKVAISYLYLKRKLLPGGVYTEPLDMILNPCPIHYVDLTLHAIVLSADYVTCFTHLLDDGTEVTFQTLRQGFV